jgi:ABC-type phosphate transport system substrate-binding protein
MNPRRALSRAPGARLRFAALAAALLSLAAAHALVPAHAHAQGGRGAVAIVTHPDAPVDDLSFAQLRSIFMGEQQFWSDRSRITLLVRAPAAAERELVLSRIYRMNEAQFRQYWIAKMFRADVPAGPKIVYTTAMTLELVAAIPGAIGFMPASEVTPVVKVIRIDGLSPGHSRYPLR